MFLHVFYTFSHPKFTIISIIIKKLQVLCLLDGLETDEDSRLLTICTFHFINRDMTTDKGLFSLLL